MKFPSALAASYTPRGGGVKYTSRGETAPQLIPRCYMLKAKGTTMRTAQCPLCQEQLEAENDDELFAKGRAHADAKHSDQNISDEQIRAVPAQDK
jgi:hypothetical protein